ncbi:MAG: class I SAM-dependent methyltransferase [Clostridia bacterium]|nr:class I SAM-dependent methyltransferase [Clostridia bacterium]
MYLSDNWKSYELIDVGGGEKFERWGDHTLLRPEPQGVWPASLRNKADAHYIRSSSGGGQWNFAKTLPESWVIEYNDLSFIVRPTGFKHTGLFPEQAVNWDWMRNKIKQSRLTNFRVLNLFAYTGGATCALAAEGAEVVHVDAAKGIVQWAKQNLAQCGLSDAPVRFIVDDAMKFVLREQRRGRTYHGILMDPPSYGRGPNGEMWKLEESLYPLVKECVKLLDDEAKFFLLNSYTTGLAPTIAENVLKVALYDRQGVVESDEVGLPITNSGLALPCGATARWYSRIR